MALRMYCVADWVNYHLYDYTDILTSLRTVQDLTVAAGSAVIRWDPDEPLAMVDYHPNVDPALPHGVTRWLDLVFDTLPQLAAPGVVEEDAPLMAWWRRWAAEGGSRHA